MKPKKPKQTGKKISKAEFFTVLKKVSKKKKYPVGALKIIQLAILLALERAPAQG
jgi:hypothetical protein